MRFGLFTTWACRPGRGCWSCGTTWVDGLGHRLRHRPLLSQHQGARGRHARVVEHAQRAGRTGAPHARGHDPARRPYRHPAVVAKMAAQVDIISGGRLLLGIGAGWQQNEHEAYGIPFYTMKERLERLDEACQVIRSLWTEERSNFKGRFYQLSDAPLDPQPVQTPHPELMIGGGGEQRHAPHRRQARRSLERVGRAPSPRRARAGSSTSTARPSAAIPRPSPARSTWPCLITDKKDEVEKLAKTIETRMGRHAADARDTCLAGTPDQIREQLHQLRGRRRRRAVHPGPVPAAAELRRTSTASSRRSPRPSGNPARAPAAGAPPRSTPRKPRSSGPAKTTRADRSLPTAERVGR